MMNKISDKTKLYLQELKEDAEIFISSLKMAIDSFINDITIDNEDDSNE